MDEKVKMPRLLKYFLFFYVGTIGVMNVTGQDMGQNILGKIFYSTSLSIFTSLACYGLISILEDLNLPFITVTEMLEGAYLTVIESEDVTTLEDALKQPPDKMEFIGSYEMNGEQFIWTEPTEKQRNHSINKYKGKLKNVDDGNGGTRPPTEIEALNTQVNLIDGWDNRILEDI